MSEVRQAPQVSPLDLTRGIEEFISANRHSFDVDCRWLAQHMESLLPPIREVRNGNCGPEVRAQIKEFRAAEIEAEIEAKRKDMDRLERDLKKIKAA